MWIAKNEQKAQPANLPVCLVIYWAGKYYPLTKEANEANTFIHSLDQTRPKANPRRSTHTIQGYRCHW